MLCYAYQHASLSAMKTTAMHPWLSTPAAAEAARRAVRIPLLTLPTLALKFTPKGDLEAEFKAAIGRLEAMAFEILTECALPPRDQAGHYSGQVTPAHIGSMHSWPESERVRYAVKTVGYALNNWLRITHKAL